ncbi:MAG: hypothetical protein CSB55_05515 [Candidatus Cloacimonadota bacterium]|nr:MAG: hypothetical protein CSB55_05515 [Candidatus Cloacimonadota bacterium]
MGQNNDVFDLNNKKKIIIIDDNDMVRSVIRSMLESLHYDCITAENGLTGLELIKKEKVDLAFIDLDMPVMDGFELLNILNKEYPTLPVLIVSGSSDIESAIRAIKKGAWDFIVKPVFNLDLVDANIKQAFEKSDLMKKNIRYEQELEEMVIKRTAKLKEQALALEKSYVELSKEIKQRMIAEEKLSDLNRKLELKVKERTGQLEKLNKKLQASVTELREDEIAGRKIQFELLPEKNKKISGYELNHYLIPSDYLSGDFIDYFNVGENHLVFYLADVSGHGVPAAFITVFLKNFVRKYLDLFNWEFNDIVLQPHEICRLLNCEMLDFVSDKFITLFYGVIDLRKNTLSCINCGQYPQPVIYKNGKAEYINLKGSPLGIIDNISAESTEIDFNVNDKIVCLSDGILEILPQYPSLKDRHDIILTLFDEHDVEGVINNHKLNSNRIPDDVTLLTIERKE